MPRPTPVTTAVVVAGPPSASLAGLAGGEAALAGTPGSVTWDGTGTDAPWIVPPAGGTARPTAPLTVVFEPADEPDSWTARWAPVTDTGPRDVAVSDDGAAQVAFDTPPEAGTWGLQLEAAFGPGRSAAWYWRVEVSR